MSWCNSTYNTASCPKIFTDSFFCCEISGKELVLANIDFGNIGCSSPNESKCLAFIVPNIFLTHLYL